MLPLDDRTVIVCRVFGGGLFGLPVAMTLAEANASGLELAMYNGDYVLMPPTQAETWADLVEEWAA